MLLAQLSDPHLVAAGTLAFGRVDTPALLGRCLAQLRSLPVAPELVVLTGDLTNSGHVHEYALLRQMLDELGYPYALALGNHDRRAALLEVFPEYEQRLTRGGFVQYTMDEYPVRLVVLDTLEEGRPGGLLCDERLDWLSQRLRESDRPTVIAMHHPPFPSGLRYMDGMALSDPERLQAIVQQHPHVHAVLCGHLHRSLHRRFAGTVASVCPSTAHQLILNLDPSADVGFTYEPSGYQLHWWNGESLASHVAVVGSYPTWTRHD